MRVARTRQDASRNILNQIMGGRGTLDARRPRDGATPLLGEKALVVLLGPVKGPGRLDRSQLIRAGEWRVAGECRAEVRGKTFLRVAVDKDSRAILGAGEAHRHRIVRIPEGFQHVLHGEEALVKRDAQSFGVIADILIGRVFGRAASVADDRFEDAFAVRKVLLGMPKSSQRDRQGRAFGGLKRFRQAWAESVARAYHAHRRRAQWSRMQRKRVQYHGEHPEIPSAVRDSTQTFRSVTRLFDISRQDTVPEVVRSHVSVSTD